MAISNGVEVVDLLMQNAAVAISLLVIGFPLADRASPPDASATARVSLDKRRLARR